MKSPAAGVPPSPSEFPPTPSRVTARNAPTTIPARPIPRVICSATPGRPGGRARAVSSPPPGWEPSIWSDTCSRPAPAGRAARLLWRDLPPVLRLAASRRIAGRVHRLRRCVALQAALSTPSAMVWVETPSNPLLRITDIAAVAERAHAQGALCWSTTRSCHRPGSCRWCTAPISCSFHHQVHQTATK